LVCTLIFLDKSFSETQNFKKCQKSYKLAWGEGVLVVFDIFVLGSVLGVEINYERFMLVIQKYPPSTHSFIVHLFK
jgi:hypothetical protein